MSSNIDMSPRKKKQTSLKVQDVQILQKILSYTLAHSVLCTLLQDCCYWLQVTDMLVEIGTKLERDEMAF